MTYTRRSLDRRTQFVSVLGNGLSTWDRKVVKILGPGVYLQKRKEKIDRDKDTPTKTGDVFEWTDTSKAKYDKDHWGYWHRVPTDIGIRYILDRVEDIPVGNIVMRMPIDVVSVPVPPKPKTDVLRVRITGHGVKLQPALVDDITHGISVSAGSEFRVVKIIRSRDEQGKVSIWYQLDVNLGKLYLLGAIEDAKGKIIDQRPVLLIIPDRKEVVGVQPTTTTAPTAPTEEVYQPSEIQAEAPKPALNWFTIGLVCIGALVVGSTIWYFVQRRKKSMRLAKGV